VVFNTGPYTVLPDNSILITANMQSETGFPSSHQLKSYVASMSRPKLAARAVLLADAGLLVYSTHYHLLIMFQLSNDITSCTRYIIIHAVITIGAKQKQNWPKKMSISIK